MEAPEHYLAWLVGGAVILFMAWKWIRSTNITSRAKRLFLITLSVIIFTPLVYLQHPAYIGPLWYFIYEEPTNVRRVFAVLVIWFVLILLIEGLVTLAKFKRRTG